MRRGSIWRTLAVFPLARMQSIGIEQGPLDRALAVAGIRAHTIQGRVSGRLAAIDRDAALGLFADAEAAAIRAASSDHSHRWADADADATEGSPGEGEAADEPAMTFAPPATVPPHTERS
jgi:putative membrane protein